MFETSIGFLALLAVAGRPGPASEAHAHRADALSSDPAIEVVADVIDPLAVEGGPGAAVVVVGRDGIRHERSYGLADLEHATAFTTSTPTQIGSVAKQFTAYGVLLLDERGLLDLDDQVHAHIPELPSYRAPLKIRHLLHHMSGLRDQWGPWWMTGVPPGAHTTQRDVLSVITRQRRLDFAPGSEYQYVNSNYTLLAEIISRVSGSDYAAFLRSEVFEPLGMLDTVAVDDLDKLVEGRATSYGRDEKGGYRREPFAYETFGPHNVLSTADDLGLWVRHLMDPENEIARSMASVGRLEDGTPTFYGKGLVRLDSNGEAHIHHFGVDAGYRAYVGYVPNEGGVVILANASDFPTPAVAFELVERLFAPGTGEDEQDEAAEIPAELRERISGRFLVEHGPALRFNTHPYESPAAYGGGPSIEIRSIDGGLALVSGALPPKMFDHDEGGLVIRTRMADIRIPKEQLASPSAIDELVVHQYGETFLVRIDPEGRDQEPRRFVGTYRSSELDLVYRVSETESGLLLHPPRMDAVPLEPEARPGTFRGSWMFDTVRFEASGRRASAMTISYGRAREMRFERIDPR